LTEAVLIDVYGAPAPGQSCGIGRDSRLPPGSTALGLAPLELSKPLRLPSRAGVATTTLRRDDELGPMRLGGGSDVVARRDARVSVRATSRTVLLAR